MNTTDKNVTKTYYKNSMVRDFTEGITEFYDCREGVLLDSYIGVTANGFLYVALETYETANSSGLTVYTGLESDLWDIWNEFTDLYDNGGF